MGGEAGEDQRCVIPGHTNHATTGMDFGCVSDIPYSYYILVQVRRFRSRTATGTAPVTEDTSKYIHVVAFSELILLTS